MRDIDKKIKSLIDPVVDLFEKKNALISKVADALVAEDGGTDVASKENIDTVLKALFKEGEFPLQVATLTDANKEAVLAAARKALDTALVASGAGSFAGVANLSIGAMKALMRNAIGEGDCVNGAHTPPKGGQEITVQESGRHLILFYLHEDESGLPLLPAIEGGSPDDVKRKLARARLFKGFKSWQGELEMDISQTEDLDAANLVITGRKFGSEVSEATLALTDIGPPRGRQLRMVFDLNEKALTRDQFQATAAHELGHALGISHRNVPSSGVLMSPKLSSIIKPTDTDVNAAVEFGKWIAS